MIKSKNEQFLFAKILIGRQKLKEIKRTPDLDADNDGPSFYANANGGKYRSLQDSKITVGPALVTANVPTRWLKLGGEFSDLAENESITVVSGKIQIPESLVLDVDLSFKLQEIVEDEE